MRKIRAANILQFGIVIKVLLPRYILLELKIKLCERCCGIFGCFFPTKSKYYECIYARNNYFRIYRYRTFFNILGIVFVGVHTNGTMIRIFSGILHFIRIMSNLCTSNGRSCVSTTNVVDKAIHSHRS
ncbi:uncharacterized protein LOC117182903 [Belonocnema kinseyi]|uniref:uncharacterized protein LOC117182903 n=1 Tax=Belonocnema kinseyi TaxID=2817044 RepID=UPI00143D2A19|nr:uncharacterized protein LOC117182903 [Belonocnema kinseyi]